MLSIKTGTVMVMIV